MPKIQILPSVLAANVGRLEEECIRAEESGADGLHLDIMDGHFVRNLSMGPSVVRMAHEAVNIPLSVHLMVTNPEIFVPAFAEAGADTILIHIESRSEPRFVLKTIRDRGLRAGIVLNPETPPEPVFDLLDAVDEVLCMTVHPGFGGQAFIAEVLPKIAILRARAPELDISVDGGLNEKTCAASAARGANVFLVGTSLFESADMARSIVTLRRTIQAAAGAGRD
jgi:ribulose-phosphate 3-epimerase